MSEICSLLITVRDTLERTDEEVPNVLICSSYECAVRLNPHISRIMSWLS
jgi:hypothetical protein